MEHLTSNILQNLRNNKSLERWKPISTDKSFFGEYLCKSIPDRSLSTFEFKSLSLDSFSKTLLEYGEAVFGLLNESMYQFSVFYLTNMWARNTLTDLLMRVQNAEVDFFDSFLTNRLIADIENGEWDQQKDQIVFNKNYIRSLEISEYSVDFINSTLKAIVRNDNQFIVQTYSNTSVGVVIILPTASNYELVSSLGKHSFTKTMRLTLPPTKQFLVRDNELFYEHIFTIKELVEFEDKFNDGEKSILLQPIKVREGKDTAVIFTQGQNIQEGIINYRTFTNTWSDWSELDDVLPLFERTSYEYIAKIAPINSNPNAGFLDLDLSSFYSNGFLFDPSQTVLLRNTNSLSSWRIGAVWTVNVYAAQDVQFDIGNLYLVLDNKLLSGVVNIKKGFHEIKVDSAYIYPLVENTEDVYYPNNIYHLITGGFGYPRILTTYYERSMQSSSIEVLYNREQVFRHSFVYNPSEGIQLLVNATPESINKEDNLLLITQRTSEQVNFIQLRIDFKRTFIGTLDAIGVSFK